MTKPYPRLPMLAISIGLVSHSYALTSLFPYVGYMVQHLGVTEDKDAAGYYAGYVSSAFMIGRVGSSYFWGRFADRYGRLPVLYVALVSTAVLSIAFGMSTTFAWALGCRVLLGLMNGLMGISKTMISEVCGKEHEMVGMGAMLGCGSIGLVVGPGLGGLLSDPATNFPSLFSESGLFGRFPYLLPNIVGAGVALVGIPAVYFFLKETRQFPELRRGSSGRGDFKPLSATDLYGVETPRTVVGDEGDFLEMTRQARGSSLEFGRGDQLPHLEEGIGWRGSVSAGGCDDRCLHSENEDENAGGCDGLEGAAGSGGAEDAMGDAERQEGQSLLPGRRESHHHQQGQGQGFADRRGFNLTRASFRRISVGSAGSEVAVDGDVLGGGGRRLKERNACCREFAVPAKLLQERRTRAILFIYAFFSFITIGSREVYPLWALSTVGSGGLDWSTKQIGQALSACGLGMLVFQLFVYPRLLKRMEVTSSQRWSCLVSMPIFLAFPLLSRLRDCPRMLMASTLGLLFLTNVVTNLIFINVSLATNNAVEPSRRATLNGLSMTTGSIAKAAGPIFFAAVFAWSVDADGDRPFPFDHHLAFYLLALGMVVVSWASWDTIVSQETTKSRGASVTYAADDSDTEGARKTIRQRA